MKLFSRKNLSSLTSHLSSRRGFTLIELLVVIAVLGVLAAGVLTAINPLQKINQAKDATGKSNVGQVANALQAYFTSNNGVYPASAASLTTSGELKVLPSDVTYSESGTTEAAASYTLKATVGLGANTIWCWRSKLGLAAAATTACTAP